MPQQIRMCFTGQPFRTNNANITNRSTIQHGYNNFVLRTHYFKNMDAIKAKGGGCGCGK